MLLHSLGADNEVRGWVRNPNILAFSATNDCDEIISALVERMKKHHNNSSVAHL